MCIRDSKLGGANGQGALAGNLNINGGTAVLGGINRENDANSGITLAGNGTLTLGGDITGASGTLTLGAVSYTHLPGASLGRMCTWISAWASVSASASSTEME